MDTREQIVRDFMEWLKSRSMEVTRFNGMFCEYVPVTEDILAEFLVDADEPGYVVQVRYEDAPPNEVALFLARHSGETSNLNLVKRFPTKWAAELAKGSPTYTLGDPGCSVPMKDYIGRREYVVLSATEFADVRGNATISDEGVLVVYVGDMP